MIAASEVAPRALPAVGWLPNRLALCSIGAVGLSASAVSVTLALTNHGIGAKVGEPLVA